MFQPEPTPFHFAAYGVPTSTADYNFQRTLGLTSGGPIVFDEPTFINNVGGFDNLNNHINIPQRYHSAMDRPPPDDLAAQEVLARGYEPELKGPLVGNKKSSHAITEEYAKADPIFVAKTSRLPQTYSHYRPILGDGNCGWRAIGFSYFESLQKLGNKDQVDEEYARMMSLTSFIEDWCGLKEWIFEDMREEVLALLKDISDTIHLGPQPDATSLVLERFNDSDRSGPIIYYFRLLASAWLRSRAAEYQGFIPDGMGVEEYCKDVLEPSNSEIEHLGMTFLIDVLLKPVGFAVEIVYLDRSEGNQVNTHLIQDVDDAGNPINPDGPLIHLLYRPGHYDILYKEIDIPLRQQQILDAANASIQINRAVVRSQTMMPAGASGIDFSSFDMSTFAAIPGISMSGMGSHHGFPAFTSFSDYDPVPAPTYIDTTVASTPAAISPISSVPSIASSTPAFPATALPIHTSQATHASHPALTSHRLALSTSDLGMSASLGSTLTSSVLAPSPGSQFRHSKYEYENDWHDSSAQTFQTSTFKNSHYNTAHYNNPNFQPEEWCPEDEEKGSGHGSGHGSGKRELRQRSM